MEIFNAKVDGGIIYIEQDGEFFKSDDSILIPSGSGDSTGYVLVGSNASIYITNTQVDLQQVIDVISDEIQSAATVPAATADTSGGSPTNEVFTASVFGSMAEKLKEILLR
jgi:hypothetical protein